MLKRDYKMLNSVFMTKPVVYFLLCCGVNVSHAEATLPSGTGLFPQEQIQVDSNLSLNACTGNPLVYANQPLLIGSTVVETPNHVEEMKTSKYGRPFKTVATASIKGGVRHVFGGKGYYE